MAIIEALVLAAGLSSRMKSNKLLLELSGGKVIEHTIERLRSDKISGITLVVGHEKEELTRQLARYDLTIIPNDEFQDGMGTSIKRGIKRIMFDSPTVDAVLIALGDMPLVKTKTVDLLLETYRAARSPVTVPVYDGRRGHPVIIDRLLFEDLARLSGDQGAKEIIGKHAGGICGVEVNDPGIHMDLDSREDYLAAKEYLHLLNNA